MLVVGASHSGSDIAYEARRHTRSSSRARDTGQIPVPIESRRGRIGFRVLVFVGTHVLNVDTPIGRKMRPHIRHGGGPLLRYRKKDLLAAGVERVLARTVGVESGLPVLDDGRVLDVRNVVWCTGFRPDFSWIRFPFEIGDDGYPVQYRGVVASSPGLYFVGLPFLHSFASMLIGGSGQRRRTGRAPHPEGARAAARCEAGRARARHRIVMDDVLVWNGRVADPAPSKEGGITDAGSDALKALTAGSAQSPIPRRDSTDCAGSHPPSRTSDAAPDRERAPTQDDA